MSVIDTRISIDPAPYAMSESESRGRSFLEADHPYRSIYQRDRDRIIHSTAFRRLQGKTQMLAASVNDHHRTRLTHTLEVTQISRTIARSLGLNEDLTEAIALAHDLGHPPFGHAGEDALQECLRDAGGFDHNLHALRRVDLLEDRYPDFPGLNLTWEVRESIALHSKRRDPVEVAPFLDVGQPLLEAQVADTADSLTYDTHDVDDALGAGLITFDDLREVTFWRRAAERVTRQHGHLPQHQFRSAVVRSLVDWQVCDLIMETRSRIDEANIQTVADVRSAPNWLVGFGEDVCSMKAELERFLYERVYHHHRIARMAERGRRFVRALFTEFTEKPRLLPERHSRRIGPESVGRVAADFIAGMTDRFARLEYRRLFLPFGDL